LPPTSAVARATWRISKPFSGFGSGRLADIREKAGLLPDTDVEFVLERGKVLIRKVPAA